MEGCREEQNQVKTVTIKAERKGDINTIEMFHLDPHLSRISHYMLKLCGQQDHSNFCVSKNTVKVAQFPNKSNNLLFSYHPTIVCLTWVEGLL